MFSPGDYNGTQDSNVGSYLFEVTPRVLAEPVTPKVRAALYRMLAEEVPGARSLGRVRDVAGQEGTGVALTSTQEGCGDATHLSGGLSTKPLFSSCTVEQRLIMNPKTGALLATELRYKKLPAGHTWTAPDGLVSYQIYNGTNWTNANAPQG